MILRRLTEHVQAQNWFAVVIDFLIVVMGVFIGLQVTTWNESRVNQKKEQSYLIRLYEDFQISREVMRRNVQRLETQVADEAAILDALDTCAVKDGAAPMLSRGFSQAGYINPPFLLRRTIDDLSNSGNLEVIKNTVIKENLAQIVRQLQHAENVSDTVLRIVEHHRFVIEENVRFENLKPDGRYAAVATAVYDIKELCASKELAFAISAIRLQTFDRQVSGAAILKDYEALLPLMEAELASRWGAVIPVEGR